MIASHILGVTLYAVGRAGVPVLQPAALEVGTWNSNGSFPLEADGDLSVLGVYVNDDAARAVLHEVTGAWCSEGAIVAARNNFVPALEVAAGNAHWLGTFHTSTLAAIATGMLKAELRDYPPVAMMVEETQLVAVRADSPLNNGTDLVNALRKDVTALRIGVAPALGSGTHLSIARPLKVAGVAIKELTIAPFKASSESMGALLGGHIDVVSATAPVIMPQVAAGKVKVLASAAPTRGIGPLADIRTWREQGVAADFVTYNGVLLPPKMSPEQIRFWEDALRKVSETAPWKALVEKSGSRPVFRNHAESMAYLNSELKIITDLVVELGLAPK